MENSLRYYAWFQKVMSVFIDIFFHVVPLASLYVFTSFLSGTVKYIAFFALIALYLAVIYFFKDKIREVIKSLLKKIETLDVRTMLLVIVISLIVIKTVYTIFFNYDGTQSGDIKIYNDIAEEILKTGDIHSKAISHLYGLALHFVVLKQIGLPIHIGLFLAISIGIIVNFISFKEIIGKDKAFLVTMVYILMPSTAFFTFSPTHEVFVFMYISVFLFFFNKLLKEKKTALLVLDAIMIVLSTVLTCFVNPGGYIIYIIMILAASLSNITLMKRVVIIVCLLASILCSNGISKFLNVNEYSTSMNTYTILIHGVNPNVLGEQEDGYPLKQMRMYIHNNTLDFSNEGFLDAARHVLIEHYIYLLKHPIVLARLIIHKMYILWSGVHYPIELAHFYDAVSGIPYLAFLGVNTMIYLFVFTVGIVYNRKKEDEIYISNYKLELLGVIALTLLCIVVNKYSVYVTMFAYMISFYRAEFTDEA